MLNQDRTSGFKTIEMDMFVLAQQPGQFSHVFRQPRHGKLPRFPSIDDETKGVLRITHGYLLYGSTLHQFEFDRDQSVRSFVNGPKSQASVRL